MSQSTQFQKGHESPNKLTIEEFVERARKLHGDDFNYSESIYKDQITKIKIKDNISGIEFYQSPTKHLRGQIPLICKSARKGRLYVTNTEDFIKAARKVHCNLYDYSESVFINMATKLKIIDPIYGIFYQSPSKHLRGQGNLNRSRVKRGVAKRKTMDEFIKEARLIHGGLYDYSKSQYINIDTKIEIIDPDYGSFFQKPYNHLNGSGHPARSGKVSKIGLSWLLSLPDAEKFITPFIEPSIIIKGKKRKVDGYNPSTNTCYEFEGCRFHGWNGKEITNQRLYDKTIQKQKDIIESGYNLVVMWEHEWTKIVTKEDWDRIPPSQTLKDLFIAKARLVHGEKYNYSKSIYKNSSQKILIIDIASGCEFWQSPNKHLSGQGYNRSRVPLTTETFVEKARKIHGNRYDYSDINYINSKTKVLIYDTVSKLKFWQKPYHHLSGHGFYNNKVNQVFCDI